MVVTILVEGPAGRPAYWWQDVIVLMMIMLMFLMVIVQINVNHDTGTRRAIVVYIRWMIIHLNLLFRWMGGRQH